MIFTLINLLPALSFCSTALAAVATNHKSPVDSTQQQRQQFQPFTPQPMRTSPQPTRTNTNSKHRHGKIATSKDGRSGSMTKAVAKCSVCPLVRTSPANQTQFSPTVQKRMKRQKRENRHRCSRQKATGNNTKKKKTTTKTTEGQRTTGCVS